MRKVELSVEEPSVTIGSAKLRLFRSSDRLDRRLRTGRSRVRSGSPACAPGLELDDQPSSRTTSLQPTMGVGRPFRRIDLCHAKRDFAGLDLLPEPIELLELLCVGTHKGCREVDIPLRDALESAEGGEGAPVTDRGDDTLVQDRSVREPIDSLREVVA